MNRILKRVLIGFGSTVGAAGVALGGVLSYVALAPNAATYCSHLRTLSEQEAGQVGVASANLTQTLAKEEGACKSAYHMPEFGQLPWAKRVRCTVKATSMAAVNDCRSSGNKVASH